MSHCLSGRIQPALAVSERSARHRPRTSFPPTGCSGHRLPLKGRGRSTTLGVRCQATVDRQEGTSSEVACAVSLLVQAADEGSVPPAKVFQAMRKLELAKLQFDDWGERLGGGPGGRTWRLVFQADSKVLDSVVKGNSEGGGQYFPVTAVASYNTAEGTTTNTAYLGQLASMKFSGTWEMKGKSLKFGFSNRLVKIGPFKFDASLDEGSPGTTGSFVFFYADDDIIVARGKSGGTAFWRRALPSYLLEKGLV